MNNTNLITLITLICLSYGIYLFFAQMLKLPTRRTKRRMKAAFNKGNLENRWVETAREIAPYIPMSSMTEKKLEAKLRSANIGLTPKTYVAKAILQGLVPFLVAVIIFLLGRSTLNIILTASLVSLSVALFLKAIEDLELAMKRKKANIEWELPRFVGSILQEFRHHRDIVRILENYKPSAGKLLAEELEITIADMKTGHMESALLRMDARLGIASMSSIVRGLIAVIQGDDGLFYFQMLEHDLKNLEYQKLKREVAKRPGKVMKYSLLVLISFLLLYGTIFLLQFISAFKTLKG